MLGNKQILPGCPQIGVIQSPDGRTIPLYQLGGFIEPPEGWALYRKCVKAANSAMDPYYTAKAAWLAEKRNQG